MKLQVIKGSAGTGKTHHIGELITNNPGKYIVLAPTNKAANVLKNRGITAHTIHSKLYMSVDTGRYNIVKKPIYDQQTKLPARNYNNEIIYHTVEEPIFEYVFTVSSVINKVLIIDEASMVPANIWYELSKTPLEVIAVGDDKQLLPIESELNELRKAIKEEKDAEILNHLNSEYAKLAPFENFFANAPADVTLTTIHRQAKTSTIHDIINTVMNRGLIPFPYTSNDAVCDDWDSLGISINDPSTAKGLASFDVVICFRNEVCSLVNTNIRAQIYANEFAKMTEYDSRKPMMGDKLYVETKFQDITETDEITITKGEILVVNKIHFEDTKNNLIYLDLVEQTTGKLYELVPVTLEFINGKRTTPGIKRLRVSYGYALTCHKTQGSQWDSVAVLDECHFSMTQNWRYTAVTRVSKFLYVAKYRNVQKLLGRK